jgi:acyl carrier protein
MAATLLRTSRRASQIARASPPNLFRRKELEPSERGVSARCTVQSSSTPSAATSPLARFPAEIQAAYERFRAAPNPADLQTVVHAALRDFMPKRNAAASAPLEPAARLIEDLGFDSLAVAETVFFFEDLFDIKIQTQEIANLRTVGELQEFVLHKLSTSTASV